MEKNLSTLVNDFITRIPPAAMPATKLAFSIHDLNRSKNPGFDKKLKVVSAAIKALPTALPLIDSAASLAGGVIGTTIGVTVNIVGNILTDVFTLPVPKSVTIIDTDRRGGLIMTVHSPNQPLQRFRIVQGPRRY